VASTVTVVPEKFQDLLEWDTKAYAHVATIGPDGAPQNNPVWFDWDGSRLLFSQTTTRQKLKNVEREPRVAISIIDPQNPYRYLEIRGAVVELQPDPDKAFIDRMAQKYLGEEKYPWSRPGDERVIVVVEPERTTSMG
jgi:PPOX class probable F420-dependent enzyme